MKRIIPYIILIILAGCASDKTPGKNDDLVYMSTTKAPTDCKYLGEIYGPHQTFTAAGINTHLGKNISQLHINRAKVLGANYVEMNSSLNGGKAYLCSQTELLDMKPY